LALPRAIRALGLQAFLQSPRPRRTTAPCGSRGAGSGTTGGVRRVADERAERVGGGHRRDRWRSTRSAAATPASRPRFAPAAPQR